MWAVNRFCCLLSLYYDHSCNPRNPLPQNYHSVDVGFFFISGRQLRRQRPRRIARSTRRRGVKRFPPHLNSIGFPAIIGGVSAASRAAATTCRGLGVMSRVRRNGSGSPRQMRGQRGASASKMIGGTFRVRMIHAFSARSYYIAVSATSLAAAIRIVHTRVSSIGSWKENNDIFASRRGTPALWVE